MATTEFLRYIFFINLDVWLLVLAYRYEEWLKHYSSLFAIQSRTETMIKEILSDTLLDNINNIENKLNIIRRAFNESMDTH